MLFFYFLIKFIIYKSNGYLVYFCIFSWISTIGVIFWALRPEKFMPNEPQHRKPKKQKKQKVKFEKNKSSLNFIKVKLKKQSSTDE